MVKFLEAFFSLLGAVAKYFSDKQLMDAGKDKATVAEYKEVERHVEEAKQAVDTPDAVRDERLRGKYDRSRRK